MLRRYTIVLNLFLVIAVIFLAERVYTIWTSEASDDPASLGVHEAEAYSTAKAVTRTRPAPRKLFDVIPTKDLFRPQRIEWVAPLQENGAATQEATPVTPVKKMRVYGIVITDDFKQAWLLEEGNQRGTPKSVAEGDALEEGWTVSAIGPDIVTLERGTETVTYPLVEQGNPKPRAAPQVIAAPPQPSPQRRMQPPPSRQRRPPTPQRPMTPRTR